MKSFDEVDRLTIAEYELLCEAYKLKMVDEDYRQHMQAFLNTQVQAVKKVGRSIRPVYSTFSKFFDYGKAIKETKEGKKEKEKTLRLEKIAEILKKGGDDGKL